MFKTYSMRNDFITWSQQKVDKLLLEKKKKIHIALKKISKDWYSFFKYKFLRKIASKHSKPLTYPVSQSGDLLEGLRIYASEWNPDAKFFRIVIISKAPHTEYLVEGTYKMSRRAMFEESKKDFLEDAKKQIVKFLKKKN